MKFTKMHGCGNDYVFVDCVTKNFLTDEISDLPMTAIKISKRRTGVGSDGLIVIKPSEKADFEMEIYNADGSLAEMCGNGIRCVGKYVYDYELTNKEHVTIDTKAGIKQLDLNIEHGKVSTVCVDMGKPKLQPRDVPAICDSKLERIFDYPLLVGGIHYPITCVSMGNPHAVVFMDDILRTDVKYIGPQVENHTMFPQKTNVEFVHVISRNRIDMRVWERGAGETFACGTGSCASVIASILHGYTENEVTVQLLGGELLIRYDETKDTVYMTGPAVTVFDGDIDLTEKGSSYQW